MGRGEAGASSLLTGRRRRRPVRGQRERILRELAGSIAAGEEAAVIEGIKMFDDRSPEADPVVRATAGYLFDSIAGATPSDPEEDEALLISIDYAIKQLAADARSSGITVAAAQDLLEPALVNAAASTPEAVAGPRANFLLTERVPSLAFLPRIASRSEDRVFVAAMECLHSDPKLGLYPGTRTASAAMFRRLYERTSRSWGGGAGSTPVRFRKRLWKELALGVPAPISESLDQQVQRFLELAAAEKYPLAGPAATQQLLDEALIRTSNFDLINTLLTRGNLGQAAADINFRAGVQLPAAEVEALAENSISVKDFEEALLRAHKSAAALGMTMHIRAIAAQLRRVGSG